MTNWISPIEAMTTPTTLAIQVKQCVDSSMREQILQDQNALHLRVGGLPPSWDEQASYAESIQILGVNAPNQI